LAGGELGVLAVDRAGAGDADVVGVNRNDERVPHLLAAAVGEWVQIAIIFGIRAAEQGDVGIQVERDAALELQRAADISAGRKGHLSAARSRAVVDGLLDCVGIERLPIADSAGIRDIHVGGPRAGAGQDHQQGKAGRQEIFSHKTVLNPRPLGSITAVTEEETARHEIRPR